MRAYIWLPCKYALPDRVLGGHFIMTPLQCVHRVRVHTVYTYTGIGVRKGMVVELKLKCYFIIINLSLIWC